VKRFNYLAAPAVPFGGFGKRVIDQQLRPPLVCLAGTLVLVAAIYGVESFRVTDAAHRYEAYVQKLSASDAAMHDVKILEARVRELQRVSLRVNDIQQSGVLGANQLAWIGNHLPKDTWLAVLRRDNGAYSLEGSADRVAAVGSAMTALRENPSLGTPRLITMSDDPGKKGSLIRYTLRLEPSTP